jgi:hypothetical protein
LGAPPINLATWYSQVRKEFDHVAPEVTDVTIDWQGKTVVALGFETDRAPYVVRNSNFGQPAGGSVRFEVPWRQGTAVDSATRSQLLLVLASSSRLPVIDVLEGQLAIERDSRGERWNLSMLVYVTPASAERIVFAAHRVEAKHQSRGGQVIGPYAGELEMLPMGLRRGAYMPFTTQGHPTISSTNFDLTIDGPGLVKLIAKHPAQKNEIEPLAEDRIGTFRIRPPGTDLPLVVTAQFTHQPRDDWPERWLTATYSAK